MKRLGGGGRGAAQGGGGGQGARAGGVGGRGAREGGGGGGAQDVEAYGGGKRGRSGAVAAASVNSGDTREEEIWTAYSSDA